MNNIFVPILNKKMETILSQKINLTFGNNFQVLFQHNDFCCLFLEEYDFFFL